MNARADLASIIIVNKNDRGIDTTLNHLKKASPGIPFEVIVVDSSLPGKMADIQAKHGSWITWDQFPYSNRRTTPEQRNRGLELANGNLIVFIDANCVPGPNWLKAIVTTLSNGEDIVCGPVLDSSKTNLVHYAPSLEKGQYIGVCTTISVGLTRRVIDSIGNFDTTFSWGQDVDFFWRATTAGFKIYYDPQVVISHDWGDRKEQLSRAFDYGKARAHLFKKHWRTRQRELISETHVWLYPLFIVGLPITYFIPVYPLLILIPMLKNRSQKPLSLVAHHLAYGLGVIAGTLKVWPKVGPAVLQVS